MFEKGLISGWRLSFCLVLSFALSPLLSENTEMIAIENSLD